MDWENLSDKFSHLGDNAGRWLKGFFGSRNERMVSTLEPIVEKVAELEGWAQGLSAEEFRSQTDTWKQAIAAEELDLEDVLPEAFALVREASVRTLGLRHFDVQIVGGVILHRGSIAEMMTGEGKTLVATLPLYLNALSGRSCYLVTVNDYLARRDANWMRPIYEYLGLSVGAIQSHMHPSERQPAYSCDIVYGTNNEFGFDYLRDNMKTRVEDQVQRELYYAIVDEVDSILIDEARTPLIISGPAERTADKYKKADWIARELVEEEHYEVKEKERQVSLVEAGIERAEELLGVDSFYSPANPADMDWPHYIENALRAHELYEKDVQYVVEPGEGGLEVVIVDEFTGRKMPGRRWSDGLHQAVETMEGLPIREENQTMATITYQNYFRLYEKLGGMTGTALTEAAEFHKIYALDVVQVPTNLPLAREDAQDLVYRTEKEKWDAIVEEIAEIHEKGQPVLVGTTSIEKSELLAGKLNRRGVPYEVLNAKQHEREAGIVANAGEKGAVTVATNMAGRGTDIKLGGNFEWRLGQALEEAGLQEGDPEHLEEIDRIRSQVRAVCDQDEKEVLGLGGLYVLGTERHEARRIDNQLRGRSGRQGNAGYSRFFLSLEDDLMRRFYRDWVKNFMERLGMTEGQAIESGMVTRAIAKAQKKVEEYNFEIRKTLLEYDEVMDEQRKAIYSVRQDILEQRELTEKVEEMLTSVTARMAESFPEDAKGFGAWFQKTYGFELPANVATRATMKEGDPEEAIQTVLTRYGERREELGPELTGRVEQWVLLHAIDAKWKDHLRAIDALKQGIGLRGYAQKDPKNEYKAEGSKLFSKLTEAIEDEVTALILRLQVRAGGEEGANLEQRDVYGGAQPGARPGARPGAARPPQARPPASLAFDMALRNKRLAEAQKRQQEEEEKKKKGDPGKQDGGSGQKPPQAFPPVGRNDPCPCGSGKKYKKCHGKPS